MSSGRIYLQQPDNTLVPFEEAPYSSEDLLQSLLERYPDLLAGDQARPSNPRRWLLIRREVGIPDTVDSYDRWSLDHLFVDDDGIPTLIEVKRSTDTRIRREVVGQMLDYAANALAHWPVGHLRQMFEANDGYNPANLDDFLNGGDPEDFWQDVKTNLQAGRIRLVFVADTIPSELRRIIEFLNGQMDPAEVVGIEIKQYMGYHAGHELRTLVPRLIGQTAEAESRKTTKTAPSKSWTRDAFVEAFRSSQGPKAVKNLVRILEWGDQNVAEVWFGREGDGGVHLIASEGKPIQNITSIWANGDLVFWYVYAGRFPAYDGEALDALTQEVMGSFPGVTMLPKRGPKIPLGQLEDSHVDQLLSLIGRIAAKVRKAEF